MGRAMPPYYGEGLNFWATELSKAINKNDAEKIQECLIALSAFIKK